MSGSETASTEPVEVEEMTEVEPPAPPPVEDDSDPDPDPHTLPPHMANLPKEFFTDKLGKPFVLFVGLVHVTHEKVKASKGRLSIINEVIKYPTREDPQAIVKCHLSVFSAEDQGDRILFEITEFGDADAANVNSAVGKHLIRMATTRAMGRSMRVYCDIGLTTADEMGKGVSGGAPRSGGFSSPTRRPFTPQRQNGAPPERTLPTATPAQSRQTGRTPPPAPPEDAPDGPDFIEVNGRRLNRQQVLKVVERYEVEANAAGLPFKRLPKGYNSPLSELVEYGQRLKAGIAEKEAEADPGPPPEL